MTTTRKATLTGERPAVVFVPGGILPADLSYGPLLAVLGPEITPLLKDPEVYAVETPPPDYGLATEVEAIRRVADEAGAGAFHLVGYSGGGAMALAFAARYPGRLRSVALVEPAWIGNGERTPAEEGYWAELERVMALPPVERMAAFMRANLPPDVAPPPAPPGPPPPWMARRPAGLEAMIHAFRDYDLDRAWFRQFQQPVYLALGDRSHPIEADKARTLDALFPALQSEVYVGRHHFDPPHRAEPERFARALHALWVRGGGAT